MNYQLFLELSTELGFRLAACGAETYRVEESVKRVLAAYGITGEAYALPYSLTATLETDTGAQLSRIRRITTSDSDLDAVERYTSLSRRICAETPAPEEAMAWLRQADATRTGYTPPYQYLAHFLGSAGFGWFYGGSVADALCAGVCGLVGCAVNRLVSRLQINKFFSIVITGFFIALTAYVFYFLGLAPNTDATIIGPLMTLVPGLLFTNAMRDIIFGDTNSGIIRVVQVLLIAVSIAVGTGTALHLCTAAFGAPAAVASLTHSVPVMLLSCAIGCVGFAIYFNIHGPGMLICVLGGVLTWGVYAAVNAVGGSDYFAYFLASAFASLFAEVMARLRKYPAISYLVVSTFPLLPGGGIYYTMSYAVQGNMVLFSQKGMQTISIAGAMAVGILMITTFFRLLSTYRAKKPKKIKNF